MELPIAIAVMVVVVLGVAAHIVWMFVQNRRDWNPTTPPEGFDPERAGAPRSIVE